MSPWVRNEDTAPLHPKFHRAGVAAFGFFEAAKCYCSRALTDGYLPTSDLQLVFPGTPRKVALRLVERLVEVGMLTPEGAGWWLHDYLEYNPSKDQVLSRRAEQHAAKVAAGKIGGVRSGERRRSGHEAAVKQNPSSDAGSAAKHNQAPSRPVPTRPMETSTSPEGACAPAAPPAAAMRGSGDTAQLVSEYARQFLDRFGVAATVNRGKDGAIARRMLKDRARTALERCLPAFFALDDEFVSKNGYTFAMFEQRISKLMIDTHGKNGHRGVTPAIRRMVDDAARTAQLIREG